MYSLTEVEEINSFSQSIKITAAVKYLSKYVK